MKASLFQIQKINQCNLPYEETIKKEKHMIILRDAKKMHLTENFLAN